jgi:hypothetical protein
MREDVARARDWQKVSAKHPDIHNNSEGCLWRPETL